MNTEPASTPDVTGFGIEEVFHHALELDADSGEREAYLEQACGADGALRQEVEALLLAHAEAESGLLSTADVPGADVARDAAARLDQQEHYRSLEREKPRDWIDRYKLLQRIGEGGFGVVWMAEQVTPLRRRVALKILKLGMDTKDVIGRFEQERQALAMMDHPNIARVFDAGATPEGRPYFVMELVRGIKITEYCDKAQLPTEERVRLFITVCQAVQHAHQKGIIHRDLKPSNILVTMHDGVPVPKVIDFGVAKATRQQPLTDLTFFTRLDQMIGTPLYMAPEQAEMSGLDVDTRSDIYSLGVLLYELLTGRTPFDPEKLMRVGQEEMRRVIREEVPPKPSTLLTTLDLDRRVSVARCHQADGNKLIKRLRGDLDWIVMKSLEKDRNRRYGSASVLAEDLQRHLDNEPVIARPPSRAYRFQRAARRHTLAFVTAGAVTVILIVGIVVSLSQAARASAESQRANAALADLRESAPGFVVQARGLFAEGDTEGALDQLDYAIELRPDSPDYLLAKADLLQSQFRFDEAARLYQAAHRIDGNVRRAETNAALSERLHREIQTETKLSKDSVVEWHATMTRENRPDIEIAPVRNLLDEVTRETLLKMAGGDAERVYKVDHEHTWGANLASLPLSDLTPLQGLPISNLDIHGTEVSDLEPLREMPLTWLDLSSSKVSNLESLEGLPLKYLFLGGLKSLDLSPLAEMETLEALLLPSNPHNLDALQRLEKLEAVSFYSKTEIVTGMSFIAQTAAHFWAARLIAAGKVDQAEEILRQAAAKERAGSSTWEGLVAIISKHGNQNRSDALAEKIFAQAEMEGASPGCQLAARAALLRSSSSISIEAIGEMIRKVETSRPHESLASSYFLTKALFAYRSGQFESAVQMLDEIDDPSHPEVSATANAVMAMAHYQAGRIEIAMAALTRAREVIVPAWSNWSPEKREALDWPDWMMAELLLQEAEKLIGTGDPR